MPAQGQIDQSAIQRYHQMFDCIDKWVMPCTPHMPCMQYKHRDCQTLWSCHPRLYAHKRDLPAAMPRLCYKVLFVVTVQPGFVGRLHGICPIHVA